MLKIYGFPRSHCQDVNGLFIFYNYHKPMYKFTLFAAALVLAGSAASAQNITLDLTKASSELTFSETTGAWDGTFDDDEISVESQCFSFLKSSMGSYKTWWGFTASNSADNTFKTDFITYQYSNMAKGGIVLNEDGTVRTDKFGAPVVDASVPYLVAYYNAYMSRRPVDMIFSDGEAHEPVGVYVNLNSYAYYSITEGDAIARAFTNGDVFTLTIHGVAEDESEKTIDVVLASYTNGDLTINRGWRYVDLSSLGAVNEIYFTMKSTDSGTWGDNTPGYFCLDKLIVKAAKTTGVENIAAKTAIAYDRASKSVRLTGSDFAVVYNTQGQKVMTAEGAEFSLESLEPGVYIVRSGNRSLKVAR